MEKQVPILKTNENQKISSLERTWMDRATSLLYTPNVDQISLAAGLLSFLIGIAKNSPGLEISSFLIGAGTAVVKMSMHSPDFSSINKPSIHLGEHSMIHRARSIGGHRFKDGDVINPGDRVGEIDIRNKLNTLPANSTAASRGLLLDMVKAFVHINEKIDSGELDGITALTGLSHLAGTKTAQLLGFEVGEATVIEKLAGAALGISYEKEENKHEILTIHDITRFMSKYKKTKRVWITIDSIQKNREIYLALEKKLVKSSSMVGFKLV